MCMWAEPDPFGLELVSRAMCSFHPILKAIGRERGFFTKPVLCV